MKRIHIISLMVALVLSLWGEPLWSQTTAIKIGWMGPLTGPIAEAGIGVRQGSLLAVEEWNAKGGIYIKELNKKLPVEIIFEDNQAKPEVGVSLGEKFVTRDKVHFIIGDAMASSVTLAVMELVPKYGIPMMSIESISDEIAKKVEKNPARYWSFWKMFYGTPTYGLASWDTYEFLIEKKLFVPRNKTIACLAEDTDYGRSSAKAVKEAFEKVGWNLVANETVPVGHTDFYPQLTKVKNLDPDILITIFVSLASGVTAVKQFHEVGLSASHLAIAYPLRPEFIPHAGKASEYLLWLPLQLDPDNIPAQKELSEKVKKRWNISLNLDNCDGYDGLNNVLDSIERAASLAPKDIVKALSKLDRKGVVGRYVFEQHNHQGKYGANYLPCPTAQILRGKNPVIYPRERASAQYVKPPWLK